MNDLFIFVILIVIYGLAALFKGLGRRAQEHRGQEGPQEPAAPAPSGLDDIRRFLQEISGGPAGPGERVPPSGPTAAEPRQPMPSSPTLRAPGRPPTRRRTPGGAPAVRVPTRRPAPTRPAAAPGRVTAQLAAPVAAPAKLLAGRLSEAKVKETLRTEEMATRAESLGKQAERLAAVTPGKLVSVAPSIQVKGYGAVTRAPAQEFLEAAQRLKRPLARAILYQEIIGLPLSLRGPERTFVERMP